MQSFTEARIKGAAGTRQILPPKYHVEPIYLIINLYLSSDVKKSLSIIAVISRDHACTLVNI